MNELIAGSAEWLDAKIRHEEIWLDKVSVKSGEAYQASCVALQDIKKRAHDFDDGAWAAGKHYKQAVEDGRKTRKQMWKDHLGEPVPTFSAH